MPQQLIRLPGKGVNVLNLNVGISITTVPTLCPHGRAALTSLPQEVLEIVINHLHGNDKVCCLPVPSQHESCHVCGWAL